MESDSCCNGRDLENMNFIDIEDTSPFNAVCDRNKLCGRGAHDLLLADTFPNQNVDLNSGNINILKDNETLANFAHSQQQVSADEDLFASCVIGESTNDCFDVLPMDHLCSNVKNKSEDFFMCTDTSIATKEPPLPDWNISTEEIIPEHVDKCLEPDILDRFVHSEFTDQTSNSVEIPKNQLPFLDDLCENIFDEEFEQFETDNDVMPVIPNLEVLLHDTTVVSESELDNNSDLIELLRDIQSDLLNQDDCEDFGFVDLFEEKSQKQKPACTRSKSARKRKKQFKKLQLVSVKENPRKGRFAQSFEELQEGQLLFEDVDSSITCPVCLEMYYLPSVCNPCGHVFCDPCLRRLACHGTEGVPCPLCRTVISTCSISKDFDEFLILSHPNIYRARGKSEQYNKYRHHLLPYTPPVPLGKRLMRQLIAGRSSQSDQRWMSHDWFKFLLGCTVGMCLSLLLMLFNRVKSIRDARDVNIVFLSILIGATVTFILFKFIKI